jgi:hypothetical protein
LQSQESGEIKAYITAYKHNDSLYTYRLYNRDSLNSIQAGSSVTKNNLLNTQAVFGYFENTINHTDSINITSPVQATLKNVDIRFSSTDSVAPGGNVANSLPAPDNCTFSISVFIEYTL